jgi:hypothetical protein
MCRYWMIDHVVTSQGLGMCPAREIDTGEKLNALADAIHEFVDFVELIEHQIGQVEMRLRRMEM